MSLASAACERCRTPIRKRRHCAPCKQAIAHLGPQYRHAAANILASSGPLSEDWANLEQWRRTVGLPVDNLLADLAADWLNKYAASILDDGEVTAVDLATFQSAAATLGWPQPAALLLQQLQRGYQPTLVLSGHLPAVDDQGALMLPRGEHCHLWVETFRHRELKSRAEVTKGSLVITNKRIQFRAPQRSGEIGLSKIIDVRYGRTRVVFESTSRSLVGEFSLADPEWVATVVTAAVQIERKILHPPGPAAISPSDEIDVMTGEEFEDYVAQVLRGNGWHIEHTARSGDFGVDLIATSGRVRKAIQCKRLSHPVGISAVQEVVAGAAHYRCNSSMVVSNQDFTRAARDLAYTHNCELIGSDQLLRAPLEPHRRIS